MIFVSVDTHKGSSGCALRCQGCARVVPCSGEAVPSIPCCSIPLHAQGHRYCSSELSCITSQQPLAGACGQASITCDSSVMEVLKEQGRHLGWGSSGFQGGKGDGDRDVPQCPTMPTSAAPASSSPSPSPWCCVWDGDGAAPARRAPCRTGAASADSPLGAFALFPWVKQEHSGKTPAGRKPLALAGGMAARQQRFNAITPQIQALNH